MSRTKFPRSTWKRTIGLPDCSRRASSNLKPIHALRSTVIPTTPCTSLRQWLFYRLVYTFFLQGKSYEYSSIFHNMPISNACKISPLEQIMVQLIIDLIFWPAPQHHWYYILACPTASWSSWYQWHFTQTNYSIESSKHQVSPSRPPWCTATLLSR